MSNIQNDKELIEAIKKGKEQVFVNLNDKYLRLVVHVANSIVNDIHSAQDIAQETFIKLYTRIESISKFE